MSVPLRTGSPTRWRPKRAWAIPAGADAGNVLASDRPSVHLETRWVTALGAAHALASLAAEDDTEFPSRAARFARRYGLLLGGANVVNAFSGQRHNVRPLEDLVAWRAWFERVRSNKLWVAEEMRRAQWAPGRRPMAANLLQARRLEWAIDDLSEERFQELRHGATWARYLEFFDQLKAYLVWHEGQPDASDDAPVFEPLALYRLAAHVVSDLYNTKVSYHQREAGLLLAEGLVRTQVWFSVDPGSPESGEVPTGLRSRWQNWLGAIVFAALFFGSPELRRCEYRNCGQSFPLTRRDKKYCTQAHAAAEQAYLSRARRMTLSGTPLTTKTEAR